MSTTPTVNTSTTTRDQTVATNVETTTTSATAPVTPKSFHSTRSSFKKSSAPQQQQQQQLPSVVAVSGTASSSQHIYDYPSSLNSSRSSLHHVVPTVLPMIETNRQDNPPDNSCVMIASTGLVSSDLADTAIDVDIISYTDANVIVKEPIVIRGAGNLTIFGVCNKFSEQFPSALNAKLAPEEFRDTIKQINSILSKELENSFKWLVVGSLFCCCTLGCSLLPVIYLNKKAKLCINKLLDIENQRMYNKLGLRWRLTKLKCNSNSLFEYILLIEFLPVLSLYQPD